MTNNERLCSVFLTILYLPITLEDATYYYWLKRAWERGRLVRKWSERPLIKNTIGQMHADMRTALVDAF